MEKTLAVIGGIAVVTAVVAGGYYAYQHYNKGAGANPENAPSPSGNMPQ